MIKAGILGATGYAGSELFRLLAAHPQVKVSQVVSQSYAGETYNDVFENYRHVEGVLCREENMKEMAENCDVLFLALPHGLASQKISAQVLDKTKIIDLGADFRIQSLDVYEHWYGKHYAETLLSQAVYGLCELNREAIGATNLVANPGCYTTCGILSLYPLVKEKLVDTSSIIVDAKSGVSGAGRGVNLGVHFCETNESIKAYKVATHRHTPEIEEQLSLAAGKEINITFTPHLIPMNRGILATCYASLAKPTTYETLREVYQHYYNEEFFVRLCKPGIFPETKWVKGSNFCDIAFTIDERTNKVIVIGALDNLVKGAAGQAVQNMNILFGLDEKTGLETIAPFPI